jgi:hypothetical protein
LLVRSVGDDIKQLLDTAAPNRRDDAKLSAMSADRVNQRGLLSDKLKSEGALDSFIHATQNLIEMGTVNAIAFRKCVPLAVE